MSIEQQIPVILSIAASDSGAGAGIQADLKTGLALKTYVCTALTAVTAQNTLGVQAMQPVGAALLAQQIKAVLDDFSVQVIKISIIPDSASLETICDLLPQGVAVIYDPVFISSSGYPFVPEDVIQAIQTHLLPKVSLFTPNIPEAAHLLIKPADYLAKHPDMASQALRQLGPKYVLLKGGHHPGRDCLDYFQGASESHRFVHPKIDSPNTHGTGCTLSTAIAAYYLQTRDFLSAYQLASKYLQHAIEAGKAIQNGAGRGALAH